MQFLTTESPGDTPASRKRELRALQRRKRHALPAVARIAAAEAIATHVSALPTFARPGYVGGYWATGGELPLHVLQLRLRPDQVWCLPCVQDDGSLKFAPWRAGDPLFSNRFGIPEPDVAPSSQLDPAQLQFACVPLLGFTRAGHRLGMGGGYYDRAFAFRLAAAAPPHLVGIAYAFQELPDFAAEAWDVPLDVVVTETETIPCRP